ncbi:hypothetical protein QYE76_028750 [Lolium multiflorum]|uniref:CCHC-type domain-containing protein n=1 Tax=Lolium multiflorum TaxID=4521 RepID=A0AAD8QMB6_LOLMU|nr:hypothetical protein QYE76_028750 [Lolium multiflorum]
MLTMTGHAEKLSDLGIVIPNKLGINRVLQSLPPSYKNFVMNYNMQNMNKELPELFGMLKAAEIEIKKEHQVLMVNKTKKQGKSKGKFKKGGKKAATPPMKPKNGPKPDAECYYCKEKGHWKRNCSKYLADLKSGLVKKKKEDRKLYRTAYTATEEANDNDHETSNEETTEPRRSTRERTTPDWYDPCLNVMIVDNNDEDPATYEEAMMSPDSNKWQEAMKSEMGSMYDNKVWTLVDLPDSRKAVENKWIFKRKTDADGMEHWTAVKNILKYLKRTKDMFLCYGGDQELVVSGYTDASWNTDPDDSKSQSGYVFILNGAAVSWASSKQCMVAKSSTESVHSGFRGFIERLGDQLLGIHLYNEGPREGAGHPKTTGRPPQDHRATPRPQAGRPPLKWPATPSQTLAAPLSSVALAKLRRSSPPPPTPRRAVGFKRSYYFRCPLEREVDVVFINNRTCDRVRRCCPFVAPEPIVIKIFYALLQAASEHLPQQQEPPLVGFGISSRVRLDKPLVATVF